ncbi:MAG TPA: kelch repeat-containing protein [Planctomycetota bacterium]|nr:kelch repeat-containing protein [Planctomycetota bacterium]
MRLIPTCAAVLMTLTGLAPAGELKSLPENKWTELSAGTGNPYVNPVYDPGTKQIVMLLAGGNGTAHLDPATGQWQPGLAPAGGAEGGDQPLLKPYALAGGRPNYKNMLIYHMTAYDSKRQRLIAGAGSFMAAYDPRERKWTDLGAKVELYGKQYPGAAPVTWGSMCYDPVNDEIVCFSGGAIYNFDNWEKDKEVTGAFGTWIFSCEKNLWTRPKIGPAAFYKARDLVRPVRIQLQDVMSATGEAIVVDRDGKAEEARKQVAGQAVAIEKAAADLKKLAADVKALGTEPRLASAAGKLESAAGKLVKDGSLDDIYKAQFEALKLVTAAVDEDLWSHPHYRTLSRMVYLPEQKAILLFGGHDQNQMLNDTWLYDCTKREWLKKSPKTLPRPRMMQVMVYDAKLKAAVMAGGYSSYWFERKDQVCEEVWTYDAAADDWKLVLGEFPFKRGEPSYFAEYSEADDAIVMVRGGRETFALRLAPGAALPAPKTEAFPKPEDIEPFLPPKEDPAVVERWKALPANTWVPADPPGWEPGEHGWGMMGMNGRLHAAIMWGGGHSTHQANEISLYFPGANRWVLAYPHHRIDIPPWNKGCGNAGGVDLRGGVFNEHARRGLSGNGGKTLINFQIFSPYWYGPEAFFKQPESWGRTTTFEFDMFSRRWRMPLPAVGTAGMCYPYNAKNTVMAVDASGARYWDSVEGTWKVASDAKCPTPPGAGEGAGNLFIEKRNQVVVIGPVGKEGTIQTWALDIAAGAWKNVDPKGVPPGRPTALAYCEADDCVYAGCFTGFDKKTPDGQEAVYSFKKNEWTSLPTKVQKRVIKPGQPWRPEGMGAHHTGWSKIAYSPRYNLLMSFQENGGMWVMRPDFEKLDWGK